MQSFGDIIMLSSFVYVKLSLQDKHDLIRDMIDNGHVIDVISDVTDLSCINKSTHRKITRLTRLTDC